MVREIIRNKYCANTYVLVKVQRRDAKLCTRMEHELGQKLYDSKTRIYPGASTWRLFSQNTQNSET